MKENLNTSTLLRNRRSSNNSRSSPRDTIQMNDLMQQQKEHFKQILRAKNKDFDGAASSMLFDTPLKHQDSLMYDESQMSSLFYANNTNDRQLAPPRTSIGHKRVMIYKNSEPNTFKIGRPDDQKETSHHHQSMTTYSNSKVLLNKYNGKLTNNPAHVLSHDNGTRFDAQVIINGGDKTNLSAK